MRCLPSSSSLRRRPRPQRTMITRYISMIVVIIRMITTITTMTTILGVTAIRPRIRWNHHRHLPNDGWSQSSLRPFLPSMATYLTKRRTWSQSIAIIPRGGDDNDDTSGTTTAVEHPEEPASPPNDTFLSTQPQQKEDLSPQIESYKQRGIHYYKQEQNYIAAAEQFQAARQLLLQTTTTTTAAVAADSDHPHSTTNTTAFPTGMIPSQPPQLLQDYATLILHETLCYIQYMEEMEEEHLTTKLTRDDPQQQLPWHYMNHVIDATTTLLNVVPNHDDHVISSCAMDASVVTAIRARAHYRRSKARYYQRRLLLLSSSGSPNENDDTSTTHPDEPDSNRTTTTNLPDETTMDHNDTIATHDATINNNPTMEQQQQLQTLMYQDARRAAFLGDKKAVQWYGQLMRQGDAGSDPAHTVMDPQQELSTRSATTTSTKTASSSSLPFDASAASTNLVSSFMGGVKGDDDDDSSTICGTATTNFMSQMLMSSLTSSLSSSSGNKNSGGSGTNPILSLIQSMLQRVTSDVQFQSTICQFLQNLSLPQIQQYLQLTGMANFVTLPTQYMEPIVQFCHAMTLVRLQRMIYLTKCLNYGRKIVQRIQRILVRYQTIIVWYFVTLWIQSSVRRPLPISKKMRRRLTPSRPSSMP